MGSLPASIPVQIMHHNYISLSHASFQTMV